VTYVPQENTTAERQITIERTLIQDNLGRLLGAR